MNISLPPLLNMIIVLIGTFVIIRATWILHHRGRILWRSSWDRKTGMLVPYEYLPSQGKMLLTFWVWDIHHFLPRQSTLDTKGSNNGR